MKNSISVLEQKKFLVEMSCLIGFGFSQKYNSWK